jgi:heat shock protein HtpX
MEYVGLLTQIRRNNIRSIVLLVLFPLTLFGLVYLGFHLINLFSEEPASSDVVNANVINFIPFILFGVLVWFTIAWFSHSSMIQKATHAKPLERKDNKRVYNLLENLCISRGLALPKLFVIEDSSLNAYASGINNKTYAVTLSRGIIDKLNDDELEGVIAHELSHIMNRDVRLLIVSIIFVGIFAFVTEFSLRSIRYGGKSKKDNGVIIIVVIALAAIGWLLSNLYRFAISRKREYMADAGAAEMTKKPQALASALEKIKGDPRIEAVERDDVAQLFIDHPLDKKKTAFSSIFATHPPIDKRIELLRQF